MKRSEKKEFVQKLKDEIDISSSVIVAHYSGLTVEESEQLRSEMRSNGAKFKVTKNRLTKLALEQTQFKNIVDLFTGPTAIAYSDDPVAPAKVAVSFEKNMTSSRLLVAHTMVKKLILKKLIFLQLFHLWMSLGEKL